MKNITDLERYRDKVYLELCLDMIEDARRYLENNDYQMAREQLNDIMESFNRKRTETIVSQSDIKE